MSIGTVTQTLGPATGACHSSRNAGSGGANCDDFSASEREWCMSTALACGDSESATGRRSPVIAVAQMHGAMNSETIAS